MMHGHEKSDSAIVAGKPTNKAVSTAAEPVERRVEAKGNARQQSTRRTQSRVSVLQALERIRQAVTKPLCRHTPKVGAVCPNWARTDLCGGRSVMSVPTADHSGLSAYGQNRHIDGQNCCDTQGNVDSRCKSLLPCGHTPTETSCQGYSGEESKSDLGR